MVLGKITPQEGKRYAELMERARATGDATRGAAEVEAIQAKIMRDPEARRRWADVQAAQARETR
jgi:hypothetical protein